MGCSVYVHYADINQKSSKATVFRTYQGWLALSETAPGEGTLQVFPNVLLSNAYIVIRPFVSPKEGKSAESFDPADWQFGMSVTAGMCDAAADFGGRHFVPGLPGNLLPRSSVHRASSKPSEPSSSQVRRDDGLRPQG